MLRTKFISRHANFDSLYDYCQNRKNEIIAKAAVIPGFLFAQRMFLASELQLTQNATTTSSNLLSNLSNLYCKSLCWLLLVIDAALLVFSKNDKLLAFAKWSLVGCIVVYIVFKMVGTNGGILATTADSIADWMGATE